MYDRALTPGELAADMAVPVAAGQSAKNAPAGLVAAYGFDRQDAAGLDSSGLRNGATLNGASWTAAGRFGGALDFAGDAIVRVPASPSLDLGTAMTLSAWIRPATSQAGWRTVVARQTDIYFLTAGSDPAGFGPRLSDRLAAGLVLAAVGWFALELVAGGGWWISDQSQRAATAAALLVIGSLLDAVSASRATVWAPLLLAAWFGTIARMRRDSAVGLVLTTMFTFVTLIAFFARNGVGARLAAHNGSTTRTAAFGVLLVVIGLLRLFRRSSPSSGGRRTASCARSTA